MKLTGEAKLVRVFVGENDRHDGRPLYEAIVTLARERKLAGATVLRGTLGFGAHQHMHTAKILRLAEDLPMVIEIIDKASKIDSFLPALDSLIGDGLVTVEKVEVVIYRGNPTE